MSHKVTYPCLLLAASSLLFGLNAVALTTLPVPAAAGRNLMLPLPVLLISRKPPGAATASSLPVRLKVADVTAVPGRPGPNALRQAVPPLTLMFCAVTQLAASPARNVTTAAISSGWPRRPNALICSRVARNCLLLPVR